MRYWEREERSQGKIQKVHSLKADETVFFMDLIVLLNPLVGLSFSPLTARYQSRPIQSLNTSVYFVKYVLSSFTPLFYFDS